MILYCLADGLCYPGIECFRHNIILIQLLIRYEGGNGKCSCQLHFFRDLCCPPFQGTLEDTGECYDVIYLIWEIASSSTNNPCTGSLCNIRHDFRNRVCHSKENGILSHGRNHFRSNDIRSRYANKDVCTL